jgi:hypothetical protein
MGGPAGTPRPGSTGSSSRPCSSSRPLPTSTQRLLAEFQSLGAGDLIADGPDYRSYWRVLAVAPQRPIVYRSVRHPWRPHPFDPSDPAAVGRVEEQLIAGGVYRDGIWTFVLQAALGQQDPAADPHPRQLRPWLLGPVMPALGLYDATYGMAQLRAIARRTEALATTPPTVKQPGHQSDRPQ